MGKSITRPDIICKISQKMHINPDESKKILEQVLDLMTDSIVKDNVLKLSSFGSFHVLSKKERAGRNPKTNKKVTVSARKSISWRASRKIKNKIFLIKRTKPEKSFRAIYKTGKASESKLIPDYSKDILKEIPI